MNLCIWLFSLSKFSGFIYVIVGINTSIIFMPEWYSIICICHILFIYSSVGGQFPFFWLLWTMLLWTLIWKFLFEHLFSFILCKFLRVELPSHTSNFLIYWDSTKLLTNSSCIILHPVHVFENIILKRSLWHDKIITLIRWLRAWEVRKLTYPRSPLSFVGFLTKLGAYPP